LDDDPALELLRVEALPGPRDDPARDDAAREEVLLREDAVLLRRDPPAWLPLPDFLLPELPEDWLLEDWLLDVPLFADWLPDLPLLLPEEEDRALREAEDRVLEDREELLPRALLLDFGAMKISFLLSCAMRRLVPQDAKPRHLEDGHCMLRNFRVLYSPRSNTTLRASPALILAA
jgi:hypothetical protein